MRYRCINPFTDTRMGIEKESRTNAKRGDVVGVVDVVCAEDMHSWAVTDKGHVIPLDAFKFCFEEIDNGGKSDE